MTGAPMMGVIALRGSMLLVVGATVSRLQSSATMAPSRTVVGRRLLWLEELSSSLAMWGTDSPMKEMGPQKAVVVAVSSPVETNMSMRVCLMCTPKLEA